jgi:hypothetical protein
MSETDGSPGLDPTAGSSHLARLSRVYSHETWNVYELLDRSLDPRGPDWLHTRARAPDVRIGSPGCRLP